MSRICNVDRFVIKKSQVLERNSLLLKYGLEYSCRLILLVLKDDDLNDRSLLFSLKKLLYYNANLMQLYDASALSGEQFHIYNNFLYILCWKIIS